MSGRIYGYIREKMSGTNFPTYSRESSPEQRPRLRLEHLSSKNRLCQIGNNDLAEVTMYLDRGNNQKIHALPLCTCGGHT